MSLRNRRLGIRVPVEVFVTEIVEDRPYRALTANVSEHGVYLNRLDGAPARRDIAIELRLPGGGEPIWARGEICHDAVDPFFRGAGVKFTAMARRDARRLRDWCVERRRRHLGELLAAIRGAAA